MAMLKGTLDVLVLKTLSWGAKHGVEIVSSLEKHSKGRLAITDAALLQSLHRLEARDLVSAEWAETPNRRQARYYRLTPAGRAHLRTEAAHLVDHVTMLTDILTTRTPRG